MLPGSEKPGGRRDLLLIYGAAFTRAAGVGLTGVVLGVYLAHAGFSTTRIGLLVGAGMAGAACGTLLVSQRAARWGSKRMLVVFSLLAAAGGIGFAMTSEAMLLAWIAFFGMMNGQGRDRGAAFALDQALIPGAVAAEKRTWSLSWYNLVIDGGHAAGALCAVLPSLLTARFGWEAGRGYAAVFVLYALLNVASAGFYAGLSRKMEIASGAKGGTKENAKVSPESKRVIRRLAALFGMDSFGGGFLNTALLSYWIFARFGIAEATLGGLFFAARVLNAVGHLVAAVVARRIGLVNTMVFTHAPSNVCLLALPFVPGFGWAAGLFLLREFLVEMDVPTRQSYAVAVVKPEERAYASGVTNLTRNISYAVAPTIAGAVMQYLNQSMPLFIGGGLKLIYDALLYVNFRKVKPSEEKG